MAFSDKTTDDDLVAMIQSGSDDAFVRLYQRYEGKLMGFLVNKIKNQEIAEEIFQMTWTKMIDNIHRYKLTKTFSSWLFTISNNTVKDWFKKTSNQNRLVESYAQIQPQTTEQKFDSNLNLAFLSEQAKAVLQLQYVDGLNFHEIAQKLSLGPANVRKISSRAKKEVKSHILNGGSIS